MIKGTKYWEADDRYYSQENNPTEAYNRARVAEGAKHILETCGPTMAVNCIAAMHSPEVLAVTCAGSYKPQPEEVLMDYFNDPRNSAVLRSIQNLPESVPENRAAQLYPRAVMDVFGVPAVVKWSARWEHITGDLSNGYAVGLCMEEPGHYIAVIAFDDANRELIYHDSWGNRPGLRNGGKHERMSLHELQTNIKPFRIVFGRER